MITKSRYTISAMNLGVTLALTVLPPVTALAAELGQASAVSLVDRGQPRLEVVVDAVGRTPQNPTGTETRDPVGRTPLDPTGVTALMPAAPVLAQPAGPVLAAPVGPTVVAPGASTPMTPERPMLRARDLFHQTAPR